jgi:hypothetical protein
MSVERITLYGSVDISAAPRAWRAICGGIGPAGRRDDAVEAHNLSSRLSLRIPDASTPLGILPKGLSGQSGARSRSVSRDDRLVAASSSFAHSLDGLRGRHERRRLNMSNRAAGGERDSDRRS